MSGKQKIVILVGPTSSGKSALAVALAREFGGEVISADSRQVYRGLDIGTGKISKKEMKGVPHHLLDVVSSRTKFSAHDFAAKAKRAITDIAARGRIPIIAGGTGLYIDVLTGRIVIPEVPADIGLRARLEKKTAAELFAMLKKRDPQRARTIERHNKRRLIRAIEIALHKGRTFVLQRSDLCEYEPLWIGIAPPLKALEKRIGIRLFVRIRQGMVREAQRLHAGGLSYKRMAELGLEYRSLARLLQRKISRQQMIEELQIAIRQYAKRQIRYWKRNKEIAWFKPSQKKAIARLTKDWLQK